MAVAVRPAAAQMVEARLPMAVLAQVALAQVAMQLVESAAMPLVTRLVARRPVRPQLAATQRVAREPAELPVLAARQLVAREPAAMPMVTSHQAKQCWLVTMK